MKNYSLIILTIVLTGCLNLLKAQNVYIPDANFKAALVNNPDINTNGDMEIQVNEAGSFTGMLDVSFGGIADMTGIEAFIDIDSLDCSVNQLTILNVSADIALKYLSCSSNFLTSLDISGCIELTYLECISNQLTNLNITTNIALKTLNCMNNQLSSLNVSSNSALTELFCNENQLANLNVSANTALKRFWCHQNLLIGLNVSANTALIELACSQNQLSSLNLLSNAGLTFLGCDNNQLSFLDISSNSALTSLSCNSNQLLILDVSNNAALISLSCTSNQLSNLNLFANLDLTQLRCGYNQISSLNLSNNSALTFLYCDSNQLSSLNMQNGHNTSLNMMNANNNPNLSCIQVDSVAYMNTHWLNAIDSTSSFSINCNYPPTNCYAHFTMSPDTIPQTWYALNQCTGNGTINYVWSWGDGSPNDSTANPSHTYISAGYYNICVSITDSAGCTNSYCDSSVYINKSTAHAVINVSVVNQLPSYIITGMESLSKAKFTIYPNPTSTTLNIQTTKSNNNNVKIYDAIGQLYLDEKLTNQNTSLNIQHLQSGIYFIKVDDKVQKFVKE